MEEGFSADEQQEMKNKTFKTMMWVAITSIVMLFAGLSSAYIVAQSGGTWVKIFPPQEFYISSIVIVLSSITFFLASKQAKKLEFKKASAFVAITLVLGIVFVFFQWQGWKSLNEKGQFFSGSNKIQYLIDNSYNDVQAKYGEDYVVMFKGKEMVYHEGEFYDKRDKTFSLPNNLVNLDKDNNAASYMYMITGLHIVHLIGGLISLLIVFFKSVTGVYNEKNHIGIQVSSIYWHFLDFLWLYLLGLLYFVG